MRVTVYDEPERLVHFFAVPSAGTKDSSNLPSLDPRKCRVRSFDRSSERGAQPLKHRGFKQENNPPNNARGFCSRWFPVGF